jgi:hypothetical protein
VGSPISRQELLSVLDFVRTLVQEGAGPAAEPAPREPTAAERAFALISLYVLQRELHHREAGDSEPCWIHRRTEQFEVLDDQRVLRRVALDFELPDTVYDVAVDRATVPKVPITLLMKAKLLNFEMRDDQGNPIPSVRRIESSTLAADGLAQWIPPEVLREVTWFEAEIKKRTPDASRLAALRELVLDPDRQPPDEYGALQPLMRTALGSVSVDLIRSYLLLVPYDTATPGRRIITLSWEEPLRQHPRDIFRIVDWLLGRLGWRHAEIYITVPGVLESRSHHSEIAAPPELEISRAQLWIGGRCVDAEGGGLARAHLHDSRGDSAATRRSRHKQLPVAIGVAVGVAVMIGAALLHGWRGLLYASPVLILATWWPVQWLRPVSTEPHLLVQLRVRRSGFLRAALATTWLTTALLVGARLRLDDILRQVEASATVLALVPGLLAAYLVRPGEHALAASHLVGVRAFLILSGASAIGAGALLLAQLDPETTEYWWTFLLCMSVASTIGITLSNVLPLHGRRRPPQAQGGGRR